jgi:hypothetical protein
MAVTKATYTATGTWTAAQLATIFESAFVASGLMSAWHDSFTSGSVENRILAVTYDGGATYGTTYYWFMFTTGGAYLHVATGWNVGSHVPTGTQYLDYFSTTTNSTSNHWRFFAGTSTSTATLTRYTSGADADQSWYLINDGSARLAFTITPATMTLQSWLDLDKGFYNGWSTAWAITPGIYQCGIIAFGRGPALRRDLFLGTALVGSVTVADYVNYPCQTAGFCTSIAYGAPGNRSNDENNFYSGFASSFASGHPAVILPTGFAATNPAYSTNSNPVFHSLPFSPYVVDPLPADFGLTFHYATNSFSVADTMVVTASVEEWEVLNYDAGTSSGTDPSPLFLARTT